MVSSHSVVVKGWASMSVALWCDWALRQAINGFMLYCATVKWHILKGVGSVLLCGDRLCLKAVTDLSRACWALVCMRSSQTPEWFHFLSPSLMRVCVFLCVSILDWFPFKNVNKSSVPPQNESSPRSCCCWIFCSSGGPGGQRSASTWDTAPPGHAVLQNKTHHTYTQTWASQLSMCLTCWWTELSRLL